MRGPDLAELARLAPWSAYSRFPAKLRALCYAGLCQELDKGWTALRTFACVEGVEPTNKVSERALPQAALWRKESFGFDSEGGNRFAEWLLTVAPSCRQQRPPLLNFLVAAG